ncbi:MAG: putative glycosyltransferase (TIGR04348 family) [Planctomycetota bacterium]|jgi:putative glycosyltransferase (TIGR04348 family)
MPNSNVKILIASPAPPGTQLGNRVTAERWRDHLNGIGHTASIKSTHPSDAELEEADVLVALHALRSAHLIRRWRDSRGTAPLILIMTGTDLYRDLLADPATLESVRQADRVVLLHRLGSRVLPVDQQDKCRVVVQSQPIRERAELRDPEHFEFVCVGHLRSVKDPLRAAHALEQLIELSEVRLTQIGRALDAEWAEQARAFEVRDGRYRWLGELPREQGLATMAGARIALSTSQMEGGANIVIEALAHQVPLIVSGIDGNLGLLGEDYPGQFPVGDTRALAQLMERCVTDTDFVASLEMACARQRDSVEPETERDCIRSLLAEVTEHDLL